MITLEPKFKNHTPQDFHVLQHGHPTGHDLYFNRDGYRSTHPDLNIGERPLSVFRKEIALLNKEFSQWPITAFGS